ncbi:uncharacterized protein B0H64DRAFT_387927 [Chaetomium fimeti]|uniref:F-box domain-containing protein n=1 Tax=Chaetomium fimeti TaxID=1854472 RepID=A0AAE0LWI4_9PEZI|nr:hypothetical protein B0H64DRAFT_387927 [Chaetomium fimeti]
MFDLLPPELLLHIVKQLSKPDLQSFSLVSQKCHRIALQPLWESVVVTSKSEQYLHHNDALRLPQERLQLARELRFEAEFYRYPIAARCPHVERPEDIAGYSTSVADTRMKYSSPFTRLAQRTRWAVEKFEDSHLQSFSWGLGACVPSGALGPSGFVTLQNHSLRSLSLITNTFCNEEPDEWCAVDLSSFSQLQSLCWIAPNGLALDTLSTAIQRNSERLRRLELDFVCWESLRYYLDSRSEEKVQQEDWCAKFFGLTTQPARLIFPAIRELSFTDLPLMADVACAVNFGTLRSLTLRRCLGWDTFLARATELNLPVRLKTFELHIIDHTPDGWGRTVIQDFLNGFKGLEDFFIDEPEQGETLSFWDNVARHQPTLKKFVHHQRTAGQAAHSRVSFGSEEVVEDLSLLPREMDRIRDDPSANPLNNLDLGFIGLSCHPNRLRSIVLPFVAKASLKVLHIRQPSPDSRGSEMSWALGRGQVGRGSDITIQSPPSEIDDVISGRCAETAAAAMFRPGLQPRFRQFAEGVFGPQGIGSLQFLVFGDYSFGGRRHDNRLIFCRDTAADRTSNFRILARNETDVAHLEEYRAAVRACPTRAFLENTFG